MIRDKINNVSQNKNILMLVTTLCYMIGILSYFNDCGTTSAFVLTCITGFLYFKNYIQTKKIILFLAVFYLGFFNAFIQIKPIDNILPLTPLDTTIEGQIISIPNSNDKTKTKFFIKTSKIGNSHISGKILVTATDPNGDFSNYKIGNIYKFEGKLRAPFKATNPSQFDYAKYLRNFRTYTTFYTTSNAEKINSTLTPKWQFIQNLNNTRNNIISTHAKFIQSPNLEILGGVVFGDDAIAPPADIKNSFVQSGLLHILAASGMNVAFIFGFWFFILFKLCRLPYKPTVISGMGIIILYTLMTGLGASVIRASLMLLFILIGKLIDRDAHSVSLLSFVALLMLIYNPAFINDVGFQLSFLVTLGLLTTGNIIFEKFKSTNNFYNFIIGTISVPIVAQIWVAPIQMFYFNTFSTYSIFANVLSVPFLSIISFGGFLSSILAMFTPFSESVCHIIDWFLNLNITIIVNISNTFANIKHSLITTTHPSLIQVALYFAIIIYITFAIKSNFNKKSISIICIATTILLISTISIPNRKLEIITFDVQNADCFLIKSPNNKYFIIDTGKSGYNGGNSQAKIILLKYLKDKGIKNIETLIITHFDNDHSGGAIDILENLNVRKVFVNTLSNKSATSSHIYKTLNTQNIPTILAQNNQTIYSNNEFTIKTYMANINRKNTDNENSAITLITHKNFDMLFMGDGTVETFDKIKPNLPQAIEILKVGHHGANGVVNQEFLNHINNQVSIISTGQNKFGHPSIGTLDTLRKTDIYRTDRHNALKIITDGNKFNIDGFNRTKRKFKKLKEYQVNITKTYVEQI